MIVTSHRGFGSPPPQSLVAQMAYCDTDGWCYDAGGDPVYRVDGAGNMIADYAGNVYDPSSGASAGTAQVPAPKRPQTTPAGTTPAAPPTAPAKPGGFPWYGWAFLALGVGAFGVGLWQQRSHK